MMNNFCMCILVCKRQQVLAFAVDFRQRVHVQRMRHTNFLSSLGEPQIMELKYPELLVFYQIC